MSIHAEEIPPFPSEARRVMLVNFRVDCLALSHHPYLGRAMILINASKESGVDDWMTSLQVHKSRAHGSLMVP